MRANGMTTLCSGNQKRSKYERVQSRLAMSEQGHKAAYGIVKQQMTG